MGETLAAVTGFSSGFIVAGGVVALMVGLGVLSVFHIQLPISVRGRMQFCSAQWSARF